MSMKWKRIQSERKRGLHEKEIGGEREIRGWSERSNKSRRDLESDIKI